MRKAAAVLYLALWLSVIISGGVLSYQQIKTHANVWEDSHPEYCTNQYDYRCGQKNPWGALFFIWMIGYPLVICFGSAYMHPRAEKLIDKAFPKNAN